MSNTKWPKGKDYTVEGITAHSDVECPTPSEVLACEIKLIGIDGQSIKLHMLIKKDGAPFMEFMAALPMSNVEELAGKILEI